MSDRTTNGRLKNLAREALHKYKGFERALTHFVDSVKREDVLLRSLLRPYLEVEQELREATQCPGSSNGQPSFSSPTQPYTRRTCVVHPGKPTASQIAAGTRRADYLGKTILDTYKIGGKAIGDYSVREALGYGRQLTREGYILRRMSGVVANADPDAKLRDVVKVKEAQRIIQEAAEVADAA